MFSGNNIRNETNIEESREIFDGPLSNYEKCVLFFVIWFLAAILVIAAWSGILLIFGAIEGGGPLGTLVNTLIYFLNFYF